VEGNSRKADVETGISILNSVRDMDISRDFSVLSCNSDELTYNRGFPDRNTSAVPKEKGERPKRIKFCVKNL